MFYTESITIYKETSIVKKIIKGFIFLGITLYIIFAVLDYLNPKNPLVGLEEKIKKVEQKEIILTEPEKQLEKLSTEKDWQEVDKETDK
jgi:predicted membrane protein